MKYYLSLLAVSLFLTGLVACSSTPPTQTFTLFTPSPPHSDTPGHPLPEAGELATATITPTQSATVLPTPDPVPVATPSPAIDHPSDSQEEVWVRDRVRGLILLYNISPAGREWLESYDLRQMVGMPGWFGSFGYDQWAGVGQAIPNSVLHEVSHSYYGAFPVSGRPELTWKRRPGEDLSSAMRQYHQDLITFMFQPPDRYEPLRERFRNLPNLSRKEDPDLFHMGEADLLYTTGGSLNLIPTILRKYFDQFLDGAGFQTWTEVIAWHLGLSSQDKKQAVPYIGITHIPLKHYRDLKALDAPLLPERIKNVLEREERQRLTDFAQQFDLIKSNEFGLVDAANVDRSFQFWRDYLRDMLKLHEKHPQVLANVRGKGPQLKDALDTFLEAKKMSLEQQIDFFKDGLKDPNFMDFAVLLPSRVLIELFGHSSDDLAIRSAGGVFGKFSQKLAAYAKAVDMVLSTGRQDQQKGSESLERFLQGLSDDQQEKDLTLIFELMRDTDRVTTKVLVNRLSDELILRMLENKASAVRGDAVSPERLLRALNITPQHSSNEIVQGLKILFEETSGNFQIDEPFTRLAYRVITDLATRDYRLGLEILGDSQVPLLDYVRASPEASVRVLSSDPSEAARLVANPKGYARGPQGIIYGLINVDPEFAARLVEELEELGERSLVVEAVAHFAYDAARLDTVPGLPISLEKDGLFLKKLMEDRGAEWLEEQLGEAISLYRQRVQRNESPGDFLEAYRTTLTAAASNLEDRQTGRTISEMIGRLFG